MTDFILNLLAITPVFAVPYALAALGLIFTEKSGVLSLGAEGFMLVGALTGIYASVIWGVGPIPALLYAALSTAIISILFAFLVVILRINQVIAGLSIVIFCLGLTSMISTRTGLVNKAISGLQPLEIWLLSDLPLVGRIFSTLDIIVYLTVPIFLGVAFVLNRTMFGLRLKAVGENPEAADAAGISVVRYRIIAIILGAALVGLAGGYLSVGASKIWVDGMTGGRGWIAVALVIFAGWGPWRALAGALLFGFIEALIPRLAAIGFQVPQYFVLMSPYFATLIVMVWTSLSKNKGGAQPAALGEPYVREERH